jgi:hypothetical protein
LPKPIVPFDPFPQPLISNCVNVITQVRHIPADDAAWDLTNPTLEGCGRRSYGKIVHPHDLSSMRVSSGHHMLKSTQALLVGALLLMLNGCRVTGIGAASRAHSEEAALRKLTIGPGPGRRMQQAHGFETLLLLVGACRKS